MIALLVVGCGEPPPPPVAVPVAAHDLPVGIHITSEDLVLVPTPPELVPPGAILDPARILDHVPSARILEGEPIRAERLANRALQVALERMVPPGLEVTVLDLDPGATHVPTPGSERVNVVNGAEVVLADLPVLRVDGQRVAVMATPEQVQDLGRRAKEATLTVVPASVPGLR